MASLVLALCTLAAALQASAEVLIFDEPPAVAAPGPVFEQPLVQVGLLSRVLLNPHFSDMQAEILQMWHLAQLRAELSVSSHLRAVAEAQARWGVYGKMPQSAPLLGVNARDPQWVGEATLREAYLLWHGEAWNATLGQRIVVWGKNEWGAAADALHGMDLRYDPTALFVAPRNLRVPAFMLTSSYSLATLLRVEAVVEPFFTPNRFFLSGHDVAALVPSGSTNALFAMALGAFTPTARDSLQQGFVGTDVPGAAPVDATAALRASGRVGVWDLAVTGIYGWDRTPIFTLDPTAQSLLSVAAAQAQAFPQIYAAALLGLLQSGNTPITVKYQRHLQLAVEGEGPVGDWVIRWDLGFAPTQLYVTRALSAVQGPTLRGALGADYAVGDRFLLSLGSTVQGVHAPGRSAALLALELASSSLPAWAVAWACMASGRYVWPALQLEARLAMLYEIWPGDGVAWAQLGYTPWESHTFALGGSYLAGLPSTLGDLYRVNAFMYAQYQGAW